MPLKNVRHTKLNFKTEPKQAPQSNDMIGVITRPNDTDNSFRLSGGSVLISDNKRVSQSVLAPKTLRDRNKQTLVRTVF